MRLIIGHGIDELLEKYHITLNGPERIYNQSLTEKGIVLEDATPHVFMLGASPIAASEDWVSFIVEIVRYLQKKKPQPVQDLVEQRTSWSRMRMFSVTELIEKPKYIFPNLYLNLDFDDAHAIWFIQDLLEIYGIDPAYCTLQIHLAPRNEPKEVQTVVHNVVKSSFTSYLMKYKQKNLNNANIIVRNFESINKVLQNVDPAYYDIFLIDSPFKLAKLKNKIIAKCEKSRSWSQSQLSTVRTYLDYYSEFFTNVKRALPSTSNKIVTLH